VDRVARAILGLQGTLAYALIFALPALEASAFVGLVFPGELAVLLGGVLAFQGRVSLGGAMGAAIAGAIVGDSLGYAIGARYGERLFATRLGRRLVKPAHRERAEELIRRKGASAVFIGRLSAVLRVLVPGLAGMSGMTYGRFLLFNVLGGALWAGGFVLLGYAAGNAWRSAARVAAQASAVVAALVVLIVAGALVARWVVRHEAAIRAWWERQPERPRVVAFRRRYERQIAFVQDRLDVRGAFGLYLTLGLAVTVAAGWAVGAAVQDLFAREELVGIDRPIGQFLAAHRSAAMSQAMRAVTVLGSPTFVVASLIVVSALAVVRQRNTLPATYLGAAVGGGYAMVGILRLLLRGARPLHAIATAGFPSGHMVAAVTLYGSVAFVISRLLRSWRVAVWAWLVAAVAVLLVATSRVYLGVHRASEVVASAALGATWLALSSTAWLAWDRIRASPAGGSHATSPARRRRAGR
jgi:membrane protein DedA with SNARE-associated domain/membrane-associated phospholipid phosphatase